MAWQYFTHKPTRIRAERWFGNMGFVPGMLPYSKGIAVLGRPDHPLESDTPVAVIQGNRGFHGVWEGDYICRGEAGELYPVPPEIFNANYDLVQGQRRQPLDDAAVEAGIANEVQSSIDRKA